MGPYATWFDIGSLFYRDFVFSGFSGFQAQLSGFSLHYHVFFSCINIVLNSFYRMHVLIQFVLL